MKEDYNQMLFGEVDGVFTSIIWKASIYDTSWRKSQMMECLGIVTKNITQNGVYLSDSNLMEIIKKVSDTLYTKDKHIKNALGERWEQVPVKPAIFIEAPTGTGKTYFVNNVLRVHCRDKHKDKMILYLANRDAVAIQQKRALLDYDPEVKKIYTRYGSSDQWLKDYNKPIAGVLVMTYQSFYGNKFVEKVKPRTSYGIPTENTIYVEDIACVVNDEAHYYLDDSKFNPATEEALKKMIRLFEDKIRIYLTATPDEIMPVLAGYEILATERIPTGYYNYSSPYYCIPVYDKGYEAKILYCSIMGSKRNLRFHRLAYSSNRSTMIENIAATLLKCKENDNTKEKTMIFVESKDFGKNLKAYIEANCKDISVAYIDSTLKASDTFNDITQNSKFSEDVLITTSVMDNGVNIIDPSVKNIMVLHLDAVKYIQSVGRKRLASGEDLNIFVTAFDLGYLNAYKNNLLNFERELAVAENDPEDYVYRNFQSYSCNAIKCILKHGDSYQINHLARIKIKFSLEYINALIERYNEDSDICIKAQLSMFNMAEAYEFLGYSKSEIDLYYKLEILVHKKWQEGKQDVLDSFKAMCDELLGPSTTDRKDRADTAYTVSRANNRLARHNLPFKFRDLNDIIILEKIEMVEEAN